MCVCVAIEYKNYIHGLRTISPNMAWGGSILLEYVEIKENKSMRRGKRGCNAITFGLYYMQVDSEAI